MQTKIALRVALCLAALAVFESAGFDMGRFLTNTVSFFLMVLIVCCGIAAGLLILINQAPEEQEDGTYIEIPKNPVYERWAVWAATIGICTFLVLTRLF